VLAERSKLARIRPKAREILTTFDLNGS